MLSRTRRRHSRAVAAHPRLAPVQVRRPAASSPSQSPGATAKRGGQHCSSGSRRLVVTAAAGDLGGGAGDYADLRELTKDDFHSCLEEAGDQLVVIDFFTDW